MKTKQQLLNEASMLKEKLAQVENNISLTESKRMQKLAGIVNESALNELEGNINFRNVKELRGKFLKYLKAFGQAWVDLANANDDIKLFNVDKEAEKRFDAFYDAFGVAYEKWGPLYQYINSDIPPPPTASSKAGAPPLKTPGTASGGSSKPGAPPLKIPGK